MDRLSSINALVISQRKEWGEILSGFETKNKYIVMDGSGHELYAAVEEGGSLILRWLLKALRPFEINIYTMQKRLILNLNRPFRFYFHRLNVYDSQGNFMGAIQKRFSILRKKYSVLDSSESETHQLFGPILHPWTFEIRKDDRELGKITKKWTGLLKEGFTDADNFGITFPASWDAGLKSIFLGAVFLIDFVHFENTGS